MAAKKGQIPSHVKKQDFTHPGLEHPLVQELEKTERGTRDKANDLNGIHLLNAWSFDNEICLGQIKVNDKSNEIKAMALLMEALDLRGTIITADALNTQKAIVKKAQEAEAE